MCAQSLVNAMNRKMIGILATSVAVGALCIVTDVPAIARGGGGGGGGFHGGGAAGSTAEEVVDFTPGAEAASMLHLAVFTVAASTVAAFMD